MTIYAVVLAVLQAGSVAAADSPIEGVTEIFSPYAACIGTAAERYAKVNATAEEVAVTAMQDCYEQGVKARADSIAYAKNWNESAVAEHRVPLREVEAFADQVMQVQAKNWAISRVVRTRAAVKGR